MSARAKPRPLSLYLAAFAAALALPPLILAAIAAARYADAEWRRLETYAFQRNEDIASELDRILSARISLLQALSTSPAIDAGDMARFEAQARQFAGQGIEVRLRALDGRLMVDTGLPPGAPLPGWPLLPEHQTVVATQQPLITDLYVSRGNGRPSVAVIVPVVRDGSTRYLVSTIFDTAFFAAMLAKAGIAPPYSVTVADRTGAIVTRSSRHEDFVGKPMPGYARAVADRSPWSGINPDGVRVSAFYARSTLSGWLVATGVDQRTLYAPLVASLWALVGIAVALLALSVAIALWLTRRMRLAGLTLIEAASAIGQGEVAAAPQTPISEVNRIGDAFAKASVRLRDQAAALEKANRELEMRVAARTRELAASEERYRLLAENGSDVVLLREKKGPILYASPSCRKLLGYSPERMLTMKGYELVHPDDVEAVAGTAGALTPDKPYASSIHRVRHEEGHWIWIQVAYTLLPRNGRDGAQVMMVMRDDTERQLNETKLKQTNESLRQFSAIVSHDLQAPLRHIAMFADMLKARVGEGDPEAADYAGRMIASVERMRRMIRSLLSYTQIANAPLKLEEVPLQKVVEDAAALLDAHMREEGARIEADDLPVVQGDAELLTRLFQNLIGNAVKYRGEAPPVVTIGARLAAGEWEVTVEDNGIGIEPQYAERIFEIFRRLHRDETVYPGAGIGLALCRRIVESHGGRLWLDTGASQGARFKLTLPAVRQKAARKRAGGGNGQSETAHSLGG